MPRESVPAPALSAPVFVASTKKPDGMPLAVLYLSRAAERLSTEPDYLAHLQERFIAATFAIVAHNSTAPLDIQQDVQAFVDYGIKVNSVVEDQFGARSSNQQGQAVHVWALGGGTLVSVLPLSSTN